MREIRTSGSTRGQQAASRSPAVLLYRLSPFGVFFSAKTFAHTHLMKLLLDECVDERL